MSYYGGNIEHLVLWRTKKNQAVSLHDLVIVFYQLNIVVGQYGV